MNLVNFRFPKRIFANCIFRRFCRQKFNTELRLVNSGLLLLLYLFIFNKHKLFFKILIKVIKENNFRQKLQK